MWATFVELLSQPWVGAAGTVFGIVCSTVGGVYAFLNRRRLFRAIDKIAHNTEPRERKDEKPEKSPAPTRNPVESRKTLSPARKFTAITEESLAETPVPPAKFTQRQFDHELLRLLCENKEKGEDPVEIVSGDLHRRVVGGSGANRMPMACNAMWKLWRRQGRKKEDIVHTTPSGKSSTIRIKYNLADLE